MCFECAYVLYNKKKHSIFRFLDFYSEKYLLSESITLNLTKLDDK